MTPTEQRIVPHLWFEKEAREATAFYASLFPDSAVTSVTTLHNTPSGDSDIVSFNLWGQKFMAISAGPYFKLNPSISFMVNFDPLFFGTSPTAAEDARRKLDEVWQKLSEGGTVLMPLDQYPFNPRYGWIQDRYGLSWQLLLGKPEGDPRPSIVPSLMFTGANAGKAEAAVDFYVSVFRNSRRGITSRYAAGQEPDKEGTLNFADFMLEGYWFAAMDSAREHKWALSAQGHIGFNEAVSLMVNCADQKEIDYYWDKLSAVPEAEQCGWLKDKYGVSWQVVPKAMQQMMSNGTSEQIARVTQAFLPMKKFDLAALEKAYRG
jgi:predicted 3-demethylubiquinone-9 3-methyltransferase (glyoxalase superfamily)